MNEKEKEFMRGLTELTRKTGILIGGCGCCGSPYLDVASDKSIADSRCGYYMGDMGELTWTETEDKYFKPKYLEKVVR